MNQPTLPLVDRRKVFLGTLDPDLNLGTRRLRQSLALYSLLFETPVIQDNFLLSGQCMRLEALDPLLSTLIRGEVIGVALRSSAEGIVPVARTQATRANEGTFFPFVGDSVSDYSSNDFRNYVDSLDRAITAGKVLRWHPASLGQAFRAKLAISADSREWEVDPLLLIEAYAAIEKINSGKESHTCTDYYKHAEMLPISDQSAVKLWARSYYLTNLPDAINISSLIPSNILTRHRFKGDSKLDWLRIEDDEELAQGILNGDFLEQIPAQGIMELRKEASFKALQDALAQGNQLENKSSIKFEFGRYKKRVYERANEFVPRFAGSLTSINREVENIKTLSNATGVLGSGIAYGSLVVAFVFGWELLYAAGASSAVFTHAIKRQLAKAEEHALEKHSKVLESARAMLRESRYTEGNLYSLLDVVHKAPTTET